MSRGYFRYLLSFVIGVGSENDALLRGEIILDSQLFYIPRFGGQIACTATPYVHHI